MFVTFSTFTDAARMESRSNGMTLLDGRDLFAMMDVARKAEPCPTCSRPMLLDRSPRGWWFRCVAPNCAGKRDLGADPGRAVELLTQQPPTGTT
jgi:hypothetical protein